MTIGTSQAITQAILYYLPEIQAHKADPFDIAEQVTLRLDAYCEHSKTKRIYYSRGKCRAGREVPKPKKAAKKNRPAKKIDPSGSNEKLEKLRQIAARGAEGNLTSPAQRKQAPPPQNRQRATKRSRSQTEKRIMQRFSDKSGPESAVIQKGFDRIPPEFWKAAEKFNVNRYTELEASISKLKTDAWNKSKENRAVILAQINANPEYTAQRAELKRLKKSAERKRKDFERAKAAVVLNRKRGISGKAAEKRLQQAKGIQAQIENAKKEYLKGIKEEDRLKRSLIFKELENDPQVKRARREIEKMGEDAVQLRNSLIQKSPLSRSQAEMIAQNIQKPDGHESKDPGLSDAIADFMQITGGMGQSSLKQIEISKDRAFANRQGMVTYGGQAHHTTLYHEIGHHVEFESDETLEIMKSWVQSRASGPPKSLKEITKNANYGPNEIAAPDEFISPYVGKIYKRSSEVFSMGIQHFAEPTQMMKLAATDPEHFALIIGALRR